MITRNNYEPITHYSECNRANEPVWNRFLDDKHLHYPDMAKVYDKFANTFGLSKDNFILTSGCEESLRIALEIIKHGEQKIRYKFIENPTWGLAEVVFNQVFYNDSNIVKIDYEPSFWDWYCNDRSTNFDLELDKEKIMYFHNKDNPNYYKEHYKDIIYITDTFSNITYHSSKLASTNTFNRDEFYIINDQEYDLRSLLQKETKFPSNNEFYIGGFSKVFGPGYRLGYLIFNSLDSKIANLYRPQYISSDAVDLIDFMASDEGKYLLNDFTQKLEKCTMTNIKLRKLPNDGKPDEYNRRIYTTFHPNYISMESESFINLNFYQDITKKLHFPIYDIQASEYKVVKLNNGIKLIRMPVPKDPKQYEDVFNHYHLWFKPYKDIYNDLTSDSTKSRIFNLAKDKIYNKFWFI